MELVWSGAALSACAGADRRFLPCLGACLWAVERQSATGTCLSAAASQQSPAGKAPLSLGGG